MPLNSDVGTALVNKISDAFGTIYKPVGIVLEAHATSYGGIVKAKGEIEETELRQRAFQRFAQEETRKQSNIESITNKVTQHLTEEVDVNVSHVETLDNDWLYNTYQKASQFSDDAVQELWAKLIAGEIKQKGSYSRKAVNTLCDLDVSQVNLFEKFVNICFSVNTPFVYDLNCSNYKDQGLDFSSILELESLGLISTTSSEFIKTFSTEFREEHKRLHLVYFHHVLICELKTINHIRAGKVFLTTIGMELSQFITRVYNEAVYQNIIDSIIENNREHVFSSLFKLYESNI